MAIPQEQPATLPASLPGSNLIPTINPEGGFALSKLDMFTEQFVQHAVNCAGTALNIGSGYGIPERRALQLGAQHIICNDVSKEQLALIEQLTPPQHRSKLTLLPGTFPDELDIPPNSVHVMGIFRVLHFFDPEKFTRALRAAYQLLRPQGVLIISAETPYMKNWLNFLPEYHKRREAGHPWPGFITDVPLYESAGFSYNLPSQMHLLDPDVLTRELTQCGFSIDTCVTFDRADLFPESVVYDGRESVGAIAHKP